MQPEEKVNLKSLTQCIESLHKVGFVQHFMVHEEGLTVAGSGRFYKPEEVRIANFYRFEGESDPADSSILYAMETVDGIKGTISDSYGPYADIDVTEFILQVEDIEKKKHPIVKHESDEETKKPEPGLW